MDMLTITLWTLLVWAEPRSESQAITSTQVPGFATREACLSAREMLIAANGALHLETRSRGVGERGIDIKLALCIPVVQERR